MLSRELKQFDAEPENVAAHFNLELLLAETSRRDETIRELRKTIEFDNSNAIAA